MADNDFICIGKTLQAQKFPRRRTTHPVDEQIVIGSACAQGARVIQHGYISRLVFMPNGGIEDLLALHAPASFFADELGRNAGRRNCAVVLDDGGEAVRLTLKVKRKVSDGNRILT